MILLPDMLDIQNTMYAHNSSGLKVKHGFCFKLIELGTCMHASMHTDVVIHYNTKLHASVSVHCIIQM